MSGLPLLLTPPDLPSWTIGHLSLLVYRRKEIYKYTDESKNTRIYEYRTKEVVTGRSREGLL